MTRTLLARTGAMALAVTLYFGALQSDAEAWYRYRSYNGGAYVAGAIVGTAAALAIANASSPRGYCARRGYYYRCRPYVYYQPSYYYDYAPTYYYGDWPYYYNYGYVAPYTYGRPYVRHYAPRYRPAYRHHVHPRPVAARASFSRAHYGRVGRHR